MLRYLVSAMLGELVLTLVPSSGIFVHFSQLFFFDLAIILAVLQLVAWIFVGTPLFTNFFLNPVSFTLTCLLFSCNAFCTL